MNTEIHKEIIQAPYKFDDQEIAAMNADLRRHLTQIKLLEGQASAAAKDFKLRIQNEENSVELICAKLDAGEENRRMEVAVRFDPSRGMKQYFEEYDEAIREFFNLIREEPMQPADWELPLFKKEEIEKLATSGKCDGNHAEPPCADKECWLKDHARDQAEPAPATFEDAEGEPTDLDGIGNDAAGATPVGDVLDQAAAATEAPKILIEHFRDGQWDSKGLHSSFWIAAQKAGWTNAQRAAIGDLLWTKDGGVEKLRPVEEMKSVLASHVIGEGTDEN